MRDVPPAVGNNAVICLGQSESATFTVQFDAPGAPAPNSMDAMLAQAFQQVRMGAAVVRPCASQALRESSEWCPAFLATPGPARCAQNFASSKNKDVLDALESLKDSK